MKKTTKFLLVLAAVVAMTIGAVSTVMAADDVVIAEWKHNGNKGWSAKDANGAAITRGWAVSADSGIYYYFKDGVMQTNTFVTSSNKTYYVNADGAMHTGWFEFTDDILVTYNSAKDVTVAEAFADRFANKATIGSSEIEALTEKTQYETVWMYFNEDGSLAMNQWAQVDNIWYYMDGPFCVMSDWSFYVAKDKATYGFDASGAMIAGWANYYKATDTTQNTGKPYEKPGTSSDSRWVYYAPNGKKAGEGWLKDSNGDWFFMKEDDVTGVSAVTNKFVEVDDMIFYFDNSGYMVTDSKTFTAPSNKALTVDGIIVAKDADGNLTYETVEAYLSLAKKASATYRFDGSNGSLIVGLKDSKYYEDNKGTKYVVTVRTVESTTGSAIEVVAEVQTDKVSGQQWTNDFLYEIDGTVYFFDNGVMVKNEAVVVGKGLILAFDKDGKLVGSKAQVIDGVKYVASTEEFLAAGIPYSVVTK